MQEEVENRSVQFAVRSTKVTAEVLLKAFKAWWQHRHNKHQMKQLHKDDPVHGKQTVKELIGQGDGVKSMPIGDEGIKQFKRIAGKYGVDFAIVKDKNAENPQYTVFFKAKDEDAILQVLKDYASKRMKNKAEQALERPSILEQLKALKELVSKIPHKVHDRWKEPQR